MTKTCGNCMRACTSPDYIPLDNYNDGECWCEMKEQYNLIEKDACEHWIGNIKLPKNDKN